MCGIFGIANHPDAFALTKRGLFSLQHRGQESAGIMVLNEGKCRLHKGMGLISEVFSNFPEDLGKRGQGTTAIGHVRYSTSGKSNLANAQPFMVEFDKWQLGLAHNGTISNAGPKRRTLKRDGAIFQGDLDTELILHIAARIHQPGEKPWAAIEKALLQVEGALSLLALCEDGMIVARDPMGFRPLSMGMVDDAYVFSSETCALDMIGAVFIRDVLPGEIIHISSSGEMSSHIFAESKRKAHCIFELIYFARPDSVMFGESVYQMRKKFGEKLAEEHPSEADIVVPVPDSGTYAAIGYSKESKIPFEFGIMRNHYIGRTFIKPSPEDRKTAVNIKLNPIREAIKNKSVCLVEDSIVRGNTSRERVKTLRKCECAKVDMRISCPPHTKPCFFGIDFPSAEELIANNHSVEEIRRMIDADSLCYLSLDGMLSCAEANKADDFCHACFSGQYPVEPQI
jgi:amidophosphoribosyltransferase